MKDRYEAMMVLAAVLDAFGYKNGDWEFCQDTKYIHDDFNRVTNNKGMKGLLLDGANWIYSDDTVMHKETARALC